MNGPPSARNPTDINSPPPQRKVSARPVVKVVLPAPGSGDPAEISSKDGKVKMNSETGMVTKRFRSGERVAYFKSELYEDGILEIGDRVPAPEGDAAW